MIIQKYNLNSNNVQENVIKYYNATQLFYNLLWATSDSLAMHYGIWEKNIQNLNEAQINENRLVSKLLNVNSSDIILDAGCGIGGTIIWMSENFGCKTIGTTICQKQVDQGKFHIKKRQLEKVVNIVLKDFTKTGYPDNSFTKIFGIEAICYAPNQEEFAREVYRLLKPKGQYLRADGFLNSNKLSINNQKIYKDWCKGWAVPDLNTVDEYIELLNKVGFINIKIINVTEKILPSANIMWWINALQYIPFKILYKLGILSQIYYMDIVAGLNQKQLFLDGITSYLIITAEKP